jgi:hypothetical protein
MDAGGAAEGGGRRVERDAQPLGWRGEHVREVVAGAGAHIDHRAGGLDVHRLGHERAGERAEVPGAEERLTRLHHLGAVAVPGHEVHVALAGYVEGVARVAAEHGVVERQPI